MATALSEMGRSECEVQQRLNSIGEVHSNMSSTDDVIVVSHAKKASTHVAGTETHMPGDVVTRPGLMDESLNSPVQASPPQARTLLWSHRVQCTGSLLNSEVKWQYSKVQRFLSQPFFVAEIFTGTPGKFVDLATTVSDFDEVLSGNCDDIPEAAFYMVGGLADVKEKAASLAAATAK